jgi:DNA-binding XRE family transcriptional regulator
MWPELEKQLASIPQLTDDAKSAPKRSQEEILEELVIAVRGLEARFNRDATSADIPLRGRATSVMRDPDQLTENQLNQAAGRPFASRSDYKRVGRLRVLRIVRGMTREALAKMSGVNLRSIINDESGTKISPDKIFKLAAALEVPPDSLLGVEDPEPSAG